MVNFPVKPSNAIIMCDSYPLEDTCAENLASLQFKFWWIQKELLKKEVVIRKATGQGSSCMPTAGDESCHPIFGVW